MLASVSLAYLERAATTLGYSPTSAVVVQELRKVKKSWGTDAAEVPLYPVYCYNETVRRHRPKSCTTVSNCSIMKPLRLQSGE